MALKYKTSKYTNTLWSASSKLHVSNYKGLKLVFLPRHGLKHTIPPHKINYRANIYALKKYGVTDIISVSAVGSLKYS